MFPPNSCGERSRLPSGVVVAIYFFLPNFNPTFLSVKPSKCLELVTSDPQLQLLVRQEAGITAAMVQTPETNNSTSTWSLSMHSTFNLRRFTSGGKSPRGIEGRGACLLRLERKKNPARWKQNTKKCTSTGRVQNSRAAKVISLGQSSRRSVPEKWDDLNDWSFGPTHFLWLILPPGPP